MNKVSDYLAVFYELVLYLMLLYVCFFFFKQKTTTVCLGRDVMAVSFPLRLETSSWRPLVTSGMTLALSVL